MSRCSDTTICPDGNCLGCRNGSQYCNDPRCYPNCPDCPSENRSESDWVIVLIILILAGVLLIVAIIYGFDYWNKIKKASEPKKITVNKNVSQVVSTPPIITVPPVPTPSAPVISKKTIVLNTPTIKTKSCGVSTSFSDFTLKTPSRCGF